MNPKWQIIAGTCLGSWLMLLPGPVQAVESVGASPDHLIHVWRSEDGLTHNAILSLAQTPDGYIWVGTRSGGLARFDGMRFVPFNPQNTPELRDVEIEELTVDAAGTLWITTGNESLTTYRNGCFTLIREQHAEPRWHPTMLAGIFTNSAVFFDRGQQLYQIPLPGPLNAVETLLPDVEPSLQPRIYRQDGQGTLWYLGRSKILCAFDGRKFSEFPAQSIPMRGPFEDLTVDGSGRLWLASSRHLMVMQNGAFTDQTPTNGLAPDAIKRIVSAGDGSLWVCEPSLIRRMLGRQWIASGPAGMGLPYRGQNARKLFGDREGGLWCLSYGDGLLHVQPNGQMKMLTEADGLPSRAVTSWLEDTEGNIWVGTIDGGLARIRPRLFQVYGSAQGMPGEAVQSVCEDANGEIWAGTVSGELARRVGNLFTNVPLALHNQRQADSLTVCPGLDGSLWVGMQTVGLLHLQPKASAPGQYQQTSVANTPIRVLMSDRAGRTWFGGGNGLGVWQNGSSRMLGTEEGFRRGFGIGTMAEDPSGTVWIGSGPGELWRWQDEHFQSCLPPDNWPPARFSAMQAESNGVVWIGTLGNGLLRFEKGVFARISSAQGLPNDYITQLLDDGQGHLWAGTYDGIFRADKTALDAVASGRVKQVACSKFGRYDGLPTLECSGGFFHPASWRAKDGRLWFATMKGLVSVNPSDVKSSSRTLPVRIEEMLIDGVRPKGFESYTAFGMTPAPASAKSYLQISPGRHSLQIRYTAFNYTVPDDVHFRWTLEGADPEWHDAGDERVLTFAPLPAGNYRFRVQAANSGGTWNEAGAALAFTIQPYFWETWWFKAVAIAVSLVALSLVVGLSIRHRYRLRLERLERQRELERERARIARDLHDDLGTNLTQISLLSALVSRENTPRRKIVEFNREIRSKSRQMAAGLNEIVWAINPRNDSLNDMLEYFGSYAGEFLSATPIRCRLDLPDQMSNHLFSAETRHNLYLAFKEALNNAAKYSSATEITVIARETGHDVLVSVRDNGKGFPPDQRADGGGNGLVNMRERMEKIGGRCTIESTPGKGTTVNFHIFK